MGGSILEQIKNNEIDELHLSNMPEDYFGETKEFVEAMSGNTSIKKVIFDKDFLSCANGQDRTDIVSCVGKLPNVESVILRDSRLMVGVCVTNLVKNAKTLEELKMEHCLLQGISTDFDLLQVALKDNPAVKSLHISECTAPNDSIDMAKVMVSLKDGLGIAVTGGAL